MGLDGKKIKHRLQFDFSDESLKMFDALAEELDATTRAEVLRHALRVYSWLVRKAKDGSDLNLSSNDIKVITGVKS